MTALVWDREGPGGGLVAVPRGIRVNVVWFVVFPVFEPLGHGCGVSAAAGSSQTEAGMRSAVRVTSTANLRMKPSPGKPFEPQARPSLGSTLPCPHR
jgi:hypothetical protein